MGFLLLLANGPPTIVAGPDDLTLSEKQTAIFTVTAREADFYQWLFSIDGGLTFEELPDANGNQFVIEAVDLFDSGKLFKVQARNQFGTSTSRTALLTVYSGLPPEELRP